MRVCKTLFTCREAAKRLGIHLKTLQAHVLRGNLRPSFKFGNMWVFTRYTLDQFKANPPGRPAYVKPVFYKAICPVCLRTIAASRDSLGSLIMRKHKDPNRMPCPHKLGLETDQYIPKRVIAKQKADKPCNHDKRKCEVLRQYRDMEGWKVQWQCSCGHVYLQSRDKPIPTD